MYLVTVLPVLTPNHSIRIGILGSEKLVPLGFAVEAQFTLCSPGMVTIACYRTEL